MESWFAYRNELYFLQMERRLPINYMQDFENMGGGVGGGTPFGHTKRLQP